MYKLANQVIDAYDDVEKKILKKIARVNPSVYMLTDGERQKLDDDDFALSVITKKASKLNKFPIESHDSAWLSNQFFNETHSRLPKEAAEIAASHIKKACEKFDIALSPAVLGMAKEASSNIYVEKDLGASDKVTRVVSVDTSKFAEIEKIANSYTFAQFAFPKVAHVKLANKYFDEYSDKMPPEYRYKYACNLQKRASELGFTLKGKISKYAATGYSAKLGAYLADRRSLLGVQEPKYTAALDKLAAMRDTLSPIEFAKILHGFDKRAGIDKYYNGYLKDPYEATLEAPANPSYIYKAASGQRLDEDAIKVLMTQKFAKVKEYLGPTLAEHLQKEGSIAFEALPNDYKELLAGIADGTL